MPLFPGTLRDLIKGGISPEQALRLFRQILNGVEAAHLQSVVHRDLKPENILIDGDRAVVADFGIAHFHEDDLVTHVVTKANDRLANFQYAAPEQRQPSATVDHRADIFALGFMLNELFTGSVPHGSEPALIAKAAPQFAYLDTVWQTMTKQNREERHQNIEKVKLSIAAATNLEFSRQTIRDLLDNTDPTALPPAETVAIVSRDYDPAGFLLAHLNVPPGVRFFIGPRLSDFAAASYHETRLATPAVLQRALQAP